MNLPWESSDFLWECAGPSKAHQFEKWMFGDFQPFPISKDLVHHPI